MAIVSYPAVKRSGGFIGGAVAEVVNRRQAALDHEFGPRKKTVDVVAVVPRISAFYAQMPERYEVVEADVLIREEG